MLPAFRVKGIWPKYTGSRQAEGTHPLTGAQLPRFQITEAILQVPRSKYDELVADHPEYRLKYLDEDKEEITIGSEFELTQKLEEPTSHSRLIKLSEDPKFYTSIPECMHAFHLADNEETRKIWTFFEASTKSRNRPAYKLWTSPKLDSGEDIMALLHQHAYEFMTGYDFEGFNSHYNYLSNVGQRLKDIIAKRPLPEMEEAYSHSSVLSTDAVESTGPRIDTASMTKAFLPTTDKELESQSATTMLPSRSDQKSKGKRPVSRLPSSFPSDIQIMDDLAALQEQLDRRLSEARSVTQRINLLSAHHKTPEPVMVDNLPGEAPFGPSDFAAKAAALNRQLDKQLQVAKHMTRTLDNYAVLRKAFSHDQSMQKRFDNQLEVAKQTTRLLRTLQRSRIEAITSIPALLTAQTSQSAAIEPTVVSATETSAQTEHLTELGKRASQDAGVKLRGQLHGLPKFHDGATKDDVHRWVAYSRDPPTFSKSEMGDVEPTTKEKPHDSADGPTKKKSVRFASTVAIDTSDEPRTTQQLLDIEENRADGWSDLAKDQHTDASSPEETASTMPLADSLSSTEITKIRELLRALDDLDKTSIVSAIDRSKNSIELQESASQAKTSQTPDDAEPILETTQEMHRPVVENAETTVAKLWCQALEGIVSNIQTLATQLETHVQPQIDKEQTALDQELRQHDATRSLENDQPFFDGVHHVQDLIHLRGTIQQTTSNLRVWSDVTQKLLEKEGMVSNHEINVGRLQSTFESLIGLKDNIEEPLCSIFRSFVPSSGVQAGLEEDSWETAYNVAPDTMSMPRRSMTAKSELRSPQSNSEAPESRLHQRGRVAADMQTMNAARGIDHSQNQSQQHSNTLFPSSVTHDQRQSESSYQNLQLLESFPPLIPFTRSERDARAKAEPAAVLEDFTSQVRANTAAPMNASIPAEADYNHQLGNIEWNLPTETGHWSAMQGIPSMWDSYQPTSRNNTKPSLPNLIPHPFVRYPSTSKSYGNQSTIDRTGVNTASPRSFLHHVDDPRANNSTRAPVKHNSTYAFLGEGSQTNLMADTSTPLALAEQALRANNTTSTLGEETHLHPGFNVGETAPVMRSPSNAVPVRNPNHSDLFELLEDIPDHADSRTAGKVAKCVKSLKALGYGVGRGNARLVVYAQAAKGDLMTALDIIEEERKAYREQTDLASGS